MPSPRLAEGGFGNLHILPTFSGAVAVEEGRTEPTGLNSFPPSILYEKPVQAKLSDIQRGWTLAEVGQAALQAICYLQSNYWHRHSMRHILHLTFGCLASIQLLVFALANECKGLVYQRLHYITYTRC